MHISDFDFDLPAGLIAQFPLAERSASRLLHVDRQALSDRAIRDLPDLVRPGDVLVFNDTKVIKARVFGRKPTGGQVEVMVERVTGEHEFIAQLRTSHAPKPGARFTLDGGAEVEVMDRDGGMFRLRLESDDAVLDVLDRVGHLPLPPYIERADDAGDETRYQTVFAREPGAVAAPTAGLHFDDELLRRLDAAGVVRTQVTLHVGAGTFQPVRVDDIREHRMHSERYRIPAATVEAIEAARAAGGRIMAIGTTSLRALEAASQSGRLVAGEGETDIFITPGYRFKTVDRLLTNFHLPKSTLLMLVSAFGGFDALRAAYAHAIAERYRFFSYGDAMLLERDDGTGD